MYSRDLVSTKVKAKDIVKEHRAFCEVERELKHFSGETLAYVTPVCAQAFILAFTLM